MITVNTSKIYFELDDHSLTTTFYTFCFIFPKWLVSNFTRDKLIRPLLKNFFFNIQFRGCIQQNLKKSTHDICISYWLKNVAIIRKIPIKLKIAHET